MKYKQLGNNKISAIGLGAMPLSLSGRPAEEDAIAVIHKALDLGVTLIDTSDAYCKDESDKHHNESLIAKALQEYSGDTSIVLGWLQAKYDCIVPIPGASHISSIEDSVQAVDLKLSDEEVK